MLGALVTGVRLCKDLFPETTALTTPKVFYLFVLVRRVANPLISLCLNSLQNRYIPILYQSWSLVGEFRSPPSSPVL